VGLFQPCGTYTFSHNDGHQSLLPLCNCVAIVNNGYNMLDCL
jgi:hypothetical protein